MEIMEIMEIMIKIADIQITGEETETVRVIQEMGDIVVVTEVDMEETGVVLEEGAVTTETTTTMGIALTIVQTRTRTIINQTHKHQHVTPMMT